MQLWAGLGHPPQCSLDWLAMLSMTPSRTPQIIHTHKTPSPLPWLFHLSGAGYFTSRPTSKGFIRSATSYLQAARQLEAFAGLNRTGARAALQSTHFVPRKDAWQS